MTFSQDAMGFFDGAIHDGLCEARILLILMRPTFFKMKLNCGRSSNTKAELLTLWCLCKVALSFGLDSIKIYGNSLIIIK